MATLPPSATPVPARTGGRRRRLALRVGAALVLVGAALLVRPGLVTQTLTSRHGLAIVAGIVALSLLFGALGRRLTGRRPVGSVAALLPVAAAVVVFVIPSLRTTRVDESLPGAPAAATAPAASAGAGMAAAASAGGAASTPSPSTAGDVPSVPPAAGAAAAPAAPAPVRVAAGDVRPLDDPASGQAVLYRLPDGSLVVRLENFRVAPTPDSFIYLVAGSGHSTPGSGVNLGKLKANSGNQNYAVPAGTRVDGPLTVLVWCRSFTVGIAAATILPV